MAKLTELWELALKSDVGIAVSTDNRSLLRQHLYQARTDADNPLLDRLTMIMPEGTDEIWLVHNNLDEEPDEHDQ